MATNCRHIFCLDCINRHLREFNRLNCPICRRKIDSLTAVFWPRVVSNHPSGLLPRAISPPTVRSTSDDDEVRSHDSDPDIAVSTLRLSHSTSSSRPSTSSSSSSSSSSSVNYGVNPTYASYFNSPHLPPLPSLPRPSTSSVSASTSALAHGSIDPNYAAYLSSLYGLPPLPALPPRPAPAPPAPLLIDSTPNVVGQATYDNLSTAIDDVLERARAIHLGDGSDLALFGERLEPANTLEDINDMPAYEAKTGEMRVANVKRLAMAVKYLALVQTGYEEVTLRHHTARVMRPQATERQRRRDMADVLRDQAAALEAGLPPKSKKRHRGS